MGEGWGGGAAEEDIFEAAWQAAVKLSASDISAGVEVEFVTARDASVRALAKSFEARGVSKHTALAWAEAETP